MSRSRADTLEAAGIVVGCSILVALPMGALFGIYQDGFFLSWWLSLLALTPGTILGFVAVSDSRLTYTHVWRFGVTHWITAVLLWQGLGIEDGQETLALASWAGAFVVGIVVAAASWWLPKLRK
ncbi:hypothetical protein ACLI4R_16110 [Natrialbaceae archaeon A-chndr2]